MDGGRPHQFPPRLEHDYPVRDGRVQTRSLEAHIVDHCNLTCAECCSLSPFLPRRFAAPQALAEDLACARTVLAPRVFKLVGGEPLLHPRIVECLEVARRADIAPVLSITTHGFLLERTDDALWEAVDALTISLYPEPALPASAIAAITARAQRFGVSLNWKRQDHFVRMTRETRSDDPVEVAAIYEACWLRERCHLLRDGRFYTCTRPPHFQSYFRGRRDFTADGIRLHRGGAMRDELLAYLKRERPLDACAHCYGGNAPLGPHRVMTRAEVAAVRKTLE